MSIFSFIGKVGKGIGKGLLGVGKTAVNVAGNVVGVGNIIPNNNGGAQQATVASINPYVVDGRSQQVAGGSLLDIVKDVGVGLGNFLNMRTHPQIDVNTGVGGRMSDTSSGLPSWLPVAGLAAGAFLLVKMMSGGGNGRRRY